jgi:PTH1 family peptidyl-tRNA hydrolase
MVILARPTTFMNRSGEAGRWLLDEFELTPEGMLVVVDDIDLPLATLRLRRSGGPGTHNGLRDLCEEVGTGFPRLRVGVRGDDLAEDLADYVLSPFIGGEAEAANAAVKRAADAVESALKDGFEAAMNVYNRPPAAE